VIGRVCLLVSSSFVRQYGKNYGLAISEVIARNVLSTKSDFHEIWHRCSASDVPNVANNF